MAEQVKVTQNGQVLPGAGDIIVVTLNAKGTTNLNAEGKVVHKYIVIKTEEGYALVALHGLMKGKINKRAFAKSITLMVEQLNNNQYIESWSVEVTE